MRGFSTPTGSRPAGSAAEAPDEDGDEGVGRDVRPGVRLLLDGVSVATLVTHRPVEDEDAETGGADGIRGRRLILAGDVRHSRYRLRIRPRRNFRADASAALHGPTCRRRLVYDPVRRLARMDVDNSRSQ